METLLEQRSGTSFWCDFNDRACVSLYEALLENDWETWSDIRKSDPNHFAHAYEAIVLTSFKKRIVNSPQQRIFQFSDAAFKDVRGTALGVTLLLGVQPLLPSKPGKKNSRQWPPPSGPLLCERQADFFDQLFEQDELRITVAMGYIDEMSGAGHALGWAAVPYHYGNSVSLHSRYLNSFAQLGFEVRSQSVGKTVFTRKTLHRGKPKNVVVTLLNPNTVCPGEDPTQNIWERLESSLCEEQKTLIQNTKTDFEAALKNDQVVVYNGHSRSGRGPDFGPFSMGQRLDLPNVLEEVPASSLKVFAHLGCKSDEYHLDDLMSYRENHPQGSFLFMRNDGAPTFHDSFAATEALVRGLLDERCFDQIETISNTLILGGFWPNKVILTPL
ncbi:MAG: hypothetical protein OM95_01290 [Bdellovibrio sp. ArHS]|uniref:hypothetical protein n=1 Tax=Bdellovibrio sp. ArHS TaxID=1569284 RepID=UPI0005823F93|nr:hypothetical protein [Bdellovibrio sp. ArHS]KHD89735.1 MAG: hypothetical protein OM95_01290 [Bdellovibrio sp. ArHS]